MKYCYPTTFNHSVASLCPNVLENINSLAVREGFMTGAPLFPQMEIVINMDDVEAHNAYLVPRKQVRSMDLAFAISSQDKRTKEMVLVDLKLNVGPSLSSILKDELVEKIVESRKTLGNEVKIHGQYIFIFQTNLVEQARRLFFKWNPRLDGENTSMDMDRLKSTYF